MSSGLSCGVTWVWKDNLGPSLGFTPGRNMTSSKVEAGGSPLQHLADVPEQPDEDPGRPGSDTQRTTSNVRCLCKELVSDGTDGDRRLASREGKKEKEGQSKPVEIRW